MKTKELWKNNSGGVLLIPSLHKLFQKMEEKRTFPNSFFEANIIRIPKADKDITRKENYKPISLLNMNTKILKNIGTYKKKQTQ